MHGQGGIVYSGAHLLQYLNGQTINGGTVDLCRSIKADYGQWAPPASSKPPAKPQPPERTPTMSALADVATMRKLVGVYLALNGKLNAKQSAALATDLKTLDSDLAKLEASLTAAPAAPVASRVAGLEATSIGGTVDLSSRSTDSYWYMRQLLALTRDPSLVGQLIGAWPVEATDTAKRFRAIASMVGEYLTLGPAIERFYPALANEDVRLAAVNAPHDINPVFAAGLAAANAEVDSCFS